MTETAGCSEWVSRLIRPEEIERYLRNGRDFVDEELIWSELEKQKNPDRSRIRDIVAKSLSLKRLDPPETPGSR
jgi:2-iminoacetate synthase